MIHHWRLQVHLTESDYAAMRWFAEDQMGFALGPSQHCKATQQFLELFVQMGIAAVREQFQKEEPKRFEEVEQWQRDHPGPLGMEWSPGRTRSNPRGEQDAPS